MMAIIGFISTVLLSLVLIIYGLYMAFALLIFGGGKRLENLFLSLVPLGFVMLYFAFKYAPLHITFN